MNGRLISTSSRSTALEGKTELKALLDWQQAISWRGELTLDGINTAKEVPDWPSKLRRA